MSVQKPVPEASAGPFGLTGPGTAHSIALSGDSKERQGEMAATNGKDDLLNSWKEIAAFLDCDERTCYRWEKSLSLPVHRLDKERKSRVFAYRSELEAWLRDRSSGPAAAPARRPRLWIIVAAAAVMISLALLLMVFLPRFAPGSRTPADFRIEGSELVILNKRGRELWRWDSGLEKLEKEDFYRSNFQTRKNSNTHTVWPLLMIKDIDADGREEILFTTQTDNEFGEGLMVCLDAAGRERWRFQAGRTMTYGNRKYSPDYRIYGFDLADLDEDGRPEIPVKSFHNNDFPCQFVVLGCDGKLKAEYWNSGQIADFVAHDFDGDGNLELLVGGTNNEYRKPFLAVFETNDISGGSPQIDPAFACRDLRPGSQARYLLLPRTDVARAISSTESVAVIHLLGNNRIEAVASNVPIVGPIYFEFDLGLTAGRVRGSHSFEIAHRGALAAGKISSRLDAEYYRALERDILSWNGSAWVKLPPPIYP